MHKDDLMTPVERRKCLDAKRPVDRMPIGIIFSSAARRFFSADLRKNTSKAQSVAEIQIKIYEEFGIDGIEVFYGLNTFGKIYGAEMSEPEIGVPAILRHPFKSLDEAAEIQPENFTVQKEKNAAVFFEALQIIREKIGNEVFYGMGFPGALTVASSLLGTERLLRSIHREPEKLHHLLSVINACLINLASDFLKDDIPVGISDPVASATIISAKQFEAFVMPYAWEFVDACQKIRPYGIGCHICGDTTKILRQMTECGYSSLSLDNRVDLAVAKEVVGSKVPISGNVPPVEVMALGTPSEVEASVRECFRKAGNSPCGFTINTGCDCSPYTPRENVEAYFRAARKCAAYPYSEENWR